MRKALYTWLCILISYSGFSQHTNDWIDYSKQYFKFKVYEDGVYRIDFATLSPVLAAAGVPGNLIRRQDFQIFGRGVELYIHVEGSNPDSTIWDYIEFYAEKNTGWLDTAFYSDPDWHANPNVSLFTDTATYYLTWDTTTSNRRLEPLANMNFSGKTSEDYFMFESRNDYFSYDHKGQYFKSAGLDLYEGEFTESQGWSGPEFKSTTYSPSVPTTNVYTAGPSATASTTVCGANLQAHNVSISVAGAGSALSYIETATNKVSYAVNPTNLSSTNTTFTFTASQGSNDRNTVPFISMEYPHTMNLGNVSEIKMEIPDASPGDTAYLNLSNFNDLGATSWLYDLSNNRRIAVNDNGSTHEVLIPNSGGEKSCYLFSEDSVTSVSSLTPVGWKGDSWFEDYSTFANDSAYLIIYNKSLNVNGDVSAYINYRRIGSNGGNHDVIAADIDELYDQFAFGIRKNPMAIRGFAEYTLDSTIWPTKPQNLLIIGKGVSYNSSRSTYGYYDRNLVPTFGWPSSDILLTAGLDGTLYAPAIPTGRIAATTPDEVGEYLNKIDQYDANQVVNIPDQLIELEEWKKQILHFAGGSGSEHLLFRSYLKTYEDTIESTSYGGRVHQFNKNSSDPIQITTSDTIEDLINGGVSILTFFGHAAGSGFDQNIDNPDAYQNVDGKYPLLIANSCLVGDIHQPGNTSNSEDWVLHPRGTIGFLASVSYGEATPLHRYTIELYTNIGKKMYGQTLGAVIQQTIKNIEDTTGANSNNLKKTCLFMTLHGDPAVVLNTRSEPDYAIRVKDVYTTPSSVSTEVDSFDMHIIVTNLGMAIDQDIGIEITRRFPPENNAPDTSTVITAYEVFYKDTFTVRLPVDLAYGMGMNNFEIKVDYLNAVDELSEINNDILWPLLIRADDIIPIYPYEFAVVPDKMQTLKASTGNPFASDTVYRFQIDTSDAFDPPLLEDTIWQSGGVVEWAPTLGSPLANLFSNPAFTDSTVFFWRVRRDSFNPKDSNHIWRESSYQFIFGKRGWGQAHFHQFKNNRYNLINYNKPNRTFDYITTPKDLWCQTIGSASSDPEYLSTEYRINGSKQVASSCGAIPAVLVAVIDPVTLLPDISSGPPCNKNVKVRVFHISSLANQQALDAYLFSIPDSSYILVYSFIYGLADTWDGALISRFQSIGWNDIADPVKGPGNYKPFIYFIKKGDISSIRDTVGATSTSIIVLTADLKTNFDFGYLTTQNIGPAQGWNSLHWDMKTLNPSDSVRLEVSGINSSGNAVVIPGLASLPPDSSDIYNLNTLIDSSIYSNIKLRAYKGDSLKTCPQLRSWHVLLDDVPESALNPSIHLSFYSDTVDEGEIISFSTVVQNVSEYDMDSLLISFWILDKNRNVIPLPSIRYKPLLQSPDTILTGLTFSTAGLPGTNSLWVEVNPLVNGEYDQLEKYHFNNIAEMSFHVTGDKMNPLVDVTFDGVHILDGDIVSAEPHIVIELKDENKYLALNDTSLMRVYLTPEGQTVGQPIDYGSTLRFIPASLPENRARVELDPGLLADGVYELKVQAKDVSQNESGRQDFLITFEVINKPSITSVMNWPNPFSTSTRFVFTLTGSEVPQDFRIRILTISGRVVREIFADELGPIHIGNNITEYAWDGKDEYGDQLANGVYLYKVKIRLNDEAMELRETSADQYFHKGYGKMYLLR